MANPKKKPARKKSKVRATSTSRVSPRKAAIPPDVTGGAGDQQLSKITGEELVAALKAEGYALRHLVYWPEKKKVEYWTQPEAVGDLKVKDLIDIIRVEKKKLELELEPPSPRPPPPVPINEKKKAEIELPDFVPGGRPIGGLINEKKKAERELPPGGVLADDALLDALAERIARRLRG